MSDGSSTLERLQDQLKWYSKKSAYNQTWFKRLKIVEIVAAAIIPFSAGIGASQFITGGLGVLIVVIESILNLYQFQSNWISYRSTAEGLKHEKFIWEARAGPYLNAENPEALFAERVESLISTEHAKWIAEQEKAGKAKEKEA